MRLTPEQIDATARAVITRWLDQLGELFGPAARAAALLTISRVAAEMAEHEEARIPDLNPEDGDCA